MDVTAHRRAAPGELVAYIVPPGPIWLDIIAAHGRSGASFMPVDVRLGAREQRRQIELARPAVVVTPEEETLFADQAPVDPDRSWVVIATSGTGGTPRLAELPRPAIGAAVAGSLDALDASLFDPWVACLTPAHVGGLLVYLRGAITGAPVHVLERFEPRRLLEEAPAGANVSLVPTMLERLVRLAEPLAGLGTLLVGGAALEPALRDAAAGLGARVVSTYGCTETCGGIAYDGIPFDDTELRIADDDRVEVRGPTLMEGYRGDPDATGACFTVDGWLRTPDVGTLDIEGRLSIIGRADDAIRTGGETVWPDEVEAVLRAHPRVADAAVRGVPHPEWGHQVAAWIVAKGDAPSLDEIRAHCLDRLAPFKAPRALHLVDVLPRTASGKLRRSALANPPHHG